MSQISSFSRDSNDSHVKKEFNTRTLWPDIIKTPENKWVYTCKEIVDRLGTDPQAAQNSKKKMEKCLMYFYMMKKHLRLFEHTYTAACILFFRYWYIYELPSSLSDCINLSQAILATACKSTENNRPIDMYVKATCEFLIQDSSSLRAKQNMEKLKWDVRDKLVNYEKKILCQFGFDLNLDNPKEIIEEIFSGYHRYNRDYDLDEKFNVIIPKILFEARNFIIQAGTQPVSLLCDGYTFTALSLIYSGLQYQQNTDPDFKFPTNFFRKRFPIKIDSQMIVDLFLDYRILEDNFFDLKSNKGEKLQITLSDIDNLIDEDSFVDGEPIDDPYSYDKLKDGEATQQLLEHTEAKIKDLFNKTIIEFKKKRQNNISILEDTNKKLKI